MVTRTNYEVSHCNFLQSPVAGFLSGPNKPVFKECKTDSQTKRQIQYDTDVTILPMQTSESKDTLSGFVQPSPTPWAGCLRHDCSRHGTKCEGLKGLSSYRTSVHMATPWHAAQPGGCWKTKRLKYTQDGQRTFNGTLGHVRVTTVAVENQQVLHILSVCVCACVCSLSYPESQAHAPYCH